MTRALLHALYSNESGIAMKRLASAALWLTIAVECGYIVFARLVLHLPWGHLVQPLAFAMLFGSLAATQGRIRWIATVVRIVLGAEFALSVADRFGLLGPPGHGVSWGDFAHFIAYTRQVNAFLPASFAPILAVVATVFEAVLGIALILGIRIPYVARAAAVLLCLFGSAMTFSGLIESQFFYGVFVLAAGACVVSIADASWVSLDNLLRRHRPHCMIVERT
ncbi:MAG TPA: DoxX family membrane protein [Terriglobales bacterium]|nr:DoxX family membrane protein [Terriglobales bacterium]